MFSNYGLNDWPMLNMSESLLYHQMQCFSGRGHKCINENLWCLSKLSFNKFLCRVMPHTVNLLQILVLHADHLLHQKTVTDAFRGWTVKIQEIYFNNIFYRHNCQHNFLFTVDVHTFLRRLQKDNRRIT